MSKHKLSLVVWSLIIAIFPLKEIFSQNENRFIRKGNNAFEKSDFQQAEIEYRRALEKNNSSLKSEFNLGGALYEMENFEGAARAFGSISNSTADPNKRSGAFYNMGNTLMKMEQYEGAIEAFKNALRLNPDDLNSKYNLEYALNQLREQQKQEQQKQQNQDQENEQEQDQDQQQQDQNNQPQDGEKDQSDDKSQDSQSEQDSQSGQQEQQQQQQESRQISKEDAERMLQALRDRERNTLDKIKRERFQDTKSVKTEKDW